MTAIEEIQSAVTSIAGSVGPAIVGIGRGTRGSGFVLDGGKVLTNAHNLRGDQVTVTFADGRRVLGDVAGVDGEGDLAVISVDTGQATPIDWADGDALAIGSPVFGIGATHGGGARVTFGLVSAVARAFRGPGGRRIDGSVEHTAPLAPGSSGGPLVNAAGQLVGLNTNRIGEGFYLALPANADLKNRVDALSRGEAPRQTRLGVAVAPSHIARRMRRSVGLPERDGLLVRGVEDGSLAAAAGIQGGDLLVEAGGRSITDADDLFAALGELDLPFDLKIVRGAEERTVRVGGPSATGEA
jgi:serine protease Do